MKFESKRSVWCLLHELSPTSEHFRIGIELRFAREHVKTRSSASKKLQVQILRSTIIIGADWFLGLLGLKYVRDKPALR